MNPIATELNRVIESANPNVLEMLSGIGRRIFFPKGILTQSAEARQKAHRFNATAGIARENGRTMHLAAVMDMISGLRPKEALTYAPSFGIAELRQLWHEQLYRKNPSLAGKPISLPVVSSGITHAIAVFADLWIDPGDTVILPEPMWGNYNMIFSVRKEAGIVQFPIFDNRNRFNVAGFEKRVCEQAEKSGKVVVLLNFPHNPTGYTVSRTEADLICGVLESVAAAGTNVLAVTDDSYFGLFYDDQTLSESIFARLCGRHPRLLAVKLDGCTKENFVWGLRVGFITYGVAGEGDTGPLYDALEKKTAGCVRGTISNASQLSQIISLKAMQNAEFDRQKAEKAAILKSRALKVRDILKRAKYLDVWDLYPFNSGYFMCLRLKTPDAERVRQYLLDQEGVGVIAIGDDNLRVAFSCVDEADIEELFEIIYRAVKKISQS
jgi:aspartate/methionine/tyrosine aminotransferase